MFVPKKNQKVFLNFIEVLRFFNKINDDVVVNNKAPHSALFSKEKGIIAGCNFSHLCSLVRENFDIKVISSGCLESPMGYLLTFEDGYLASLENEKKDPEPVKVEKIPGIVEVKEEEEESKTEEVVEVKPKRKTATKKA